MGGEQNSTPKTLSSRSAIFTTSFSPSKGNKETEIGAKSERLKYANTLLREKTKILSPDPSQGNGGNINNNKKSNSAGDSKGKDETPMSKLPSQNPAPDTKPSNLGNGSNNPLQLRIEAIIKT